jgi:hypothetical protein
VSLAFPTWVFVAAAGVMLGLAILAAYLFTRRDA